VDGAYDWHSVLRDCTTAHQATMGNDTTYTRMIAEEAIPWEQANWHHEGPARIVPIRS